MTPVTVVVVEDSPTQRAMIVRAIEEDHGARVVAEATSSAQAVDAVARWRPDVVTLDLEIPGGRNNRPGAGGLEAVRGIMARAPTPILVLSAHGGRGSEPALQALAAGATDAVPKPRTWTDSDRGDLRRRVRTLRGVAVVGRRAAEPPAPGGPDAPAPAAATGIAETAGDGAAASVRGPIVGLVASTGGPPALSRVLDGLRGLDAPIVIVQHLHPDFCAGFATWLHDTTGVPVGLLSGGEPLRSGHAYLAPGGRHVRLGADGQLSLHDRPDTLHKPSGDELLLSLAAHAGAGAVGAVLTGMGEDGAAGLRAIADRGGACVAQDAASCAVFGMPRAALEFGAVRSTTPLDAIPTALRHAVAARRRRAR